MVFVLDKRGRPLMPCTEKRARLVLSRGRARIHRLLPMVIRLIDRSVDDCVLQPLRVKLDPGSKSTGVALVRDTDTLDASSGESKRRGTVLLLLELAHRGRQILENLTARRSLRRRRRGTLRYRAPRFLNRGNKARGWLAPSLKHRIDSTLTWVSRLRRWAPVKALSSELVRFDTPALENPEISGVKCCHGTLFGYDVREYLLEKWGRRCAYCDAKDTPLQIEHIRSRARGGSDRVSNLTLACEPCNQKKAARAIEKFLARDPVRLARVIGDAKRPLRDAAAVNATRLALVAALRATGLPVETASGARTKFNRSTLGIPKAHALDAACVGQIDSLRGWRQPTLRVKSMGRGSYQRTRVTAHGFPRGYLLRAKRIHGFGTGDMITARVLGGKKAGVYRGRVAVRASGFFNIQTAHGVVQGVSYQHCQLIQRCDGYGYNYVTHPPVVDNPRITTNTSDASHPTLSLPGVNAGISREES